MFKSLKSAILTITLFLFPLFFLPITQEYFTTNKFYLISAASLVLLLISAAEILFSKTRYQTIPGDARYRIVPGKIDLLKIFFLTAVLLSTIISSPNKIQALLNPNFGFVALLSIAIFTLYIDRASVVVSKILSFSTLILSATTIVFFFHPFRSSQFPFELQFLKNRFFTPLGSQTDLAIFLGFMIVVEILQFALTLSAKKNTPINSSKFLYIPLISSIILTLSAFSLAVYSLLSGGADRVMPFAYSWYSFAETLKNPMTAIFGVGIDNIASVFTRVKDIPYNLSSLWEIRSFDFSRTSLLHIATESGLLGLSAIILILIWAYKKILTKDEEKEISYERLENSNRNENLEIRKYPISNIQYPLPISSLQKPVSKRPQKLLLIPLLYLTAILLFFPPTITVFFIFFIGLTSVDDNKQINPPLISSNFPLNPSSKFLYFPFAFALILLTAASSFFLSRSYSAELYFKKSIDALAQKNGKALYENQRKAVQVNPFIERFHLNFSQTNLLLSNTLRVGQSTKAPTDSDTRRVDKSTNVLPAGEKSKNDPTWKAAAQTAIVEANNAVILNPQKASNWENLGLISRNLADVFEDAQKQTIEAYEKAILLDPQNPVYRLSLGSIYYLQQDFDQAVRLFEQTASLKKNWPNGHYNLSWALFQKQEYQKAIQEMLTSVSLLDPEKDKADREKAQKDLEMMRNKVKSRTPFLLPAPYVSTSEPQLDFSEIASPEAE